MYLSVFSKASAAAHMRTASLSSGEIDKQSQGVDAFLISPQQSNGRWRMILSFLHLEQIILSLFHLISLKSSTKLSSGLLLFSHPYLTSRSPTRPTWDQLPNKELALEFSPGLCWNPTQKANFT